MAKSKEKIIDGIIQEVTKLQMTDDHALFAGREWLGDKLDTYRATVLKKYSNEKGDLSSAYQPIDCLEPIYHKVSCVIDGITVDAKSGLWEIKIPELLGLAKAIKYFGLFNLSKGFIKESITDLGNLVSRWDRRTYRYALVGEKIYSYDLEGIKSLTLIAIAASPSDVCGFKDTEPYPLPKELEAQLELLIKKDLFVMLGISSDLLNDAKDMPTQEVKDGDRR